MTSSRRIAAVATLVLCLGLSGCGWPAIAAAVAILATQKSSKSTQITPTVQVVSVTPSSASHGSGATLVIKGSNFQQNGLVVTIGGVQAAVQKFVSSNEVDVTMPVLPKAGPTNVLVVCQGANPGELDGAFTVTNTPPTLAIDQVTSPITGNVAVQVHLTDSDSILTTDTSDLTVEYSVNKGAFQAVTGAMLVGGSASVQTIPTSGPAGSTGPQQSGHVFVVDTTKILASQNYTLQFRVTPVDDYDSADLAAQVRTGTPVLTNTFNVVNNVPPTVKPVSAPKEDDNVISLVFQVDDVNQGSNLTLAGVTYTNVQTGASGTASVASSSPTHVGSALTKQQNTLFQWDSRKDLGFGNDALIQFTVTVSNGSNTTNAQFTPFIVDNGPFLPTQTVPTVTLPGQADVADVNSDGIPDIVVAMDTLSEIRILQGDATNSFTTAAVCSYGTSGAGRVLPGPICVAPIATATGSGTVKVPTILCADLADVSSGISAANFDSGTGTYPTPRTVISMAAIQALYPNGRVKAIAHGDFSNPPDGLEDLVVLVRDGNTPQKGGFAEPGQGFGELLLFEQTSSGGFKTGVPITPRTYWFGIVGTNTVDQQPGDFRVKDAERDGRPDVVLAATAENAVYVFGPGPLAVPGDVALVQSAALTVSVPGQFLKTADLGDVNGDGYDDVVALTNDGVSNATILVFLADGKGGFSSTPNHTIKVARNLEDLRCFNVTGPTDHDSFDDVIVSDSVSTNVSVFVSAPTTSSGFIQSSSGTPVEYDFATGNNGVRHLAVGDVNGDGFADVVATTNGSTAAIFQTAVPRLFREPVPVAVQNPALTLAGCDLLTGDGMDEVCSIDAITKDLIVLGSDPALTMSPKKFGPFRAQQRVIAIDSTGSGKKDAILHLVPSADGLTILGAAIIPQNSSDLLSSRPSVTGSFLDPLTIVDQLASKGSYPGVASVSPAAPNFLTSSRFTSAPGQPQATTVITLTGGTKFVFFEQQLGLGGLVGFPAVVSHELGAAFGDVGRGIVSGSNGPLTAPGLPDLVVSPVATNFAGLAGIFVIYGDSSVAAGGFTKAQQILGPPSRPGTVSVSGTASQTGTFDNSSGGYIDIQLADLANTGHLSVVAGVLQDTNPPDTTGASENTLTILDQDANGYGLTPFYDFDPGSPGSGLPFVGMFLGIADFNLDGYADLALSSNLGPSVNVLLNRGAAGLRNGGRSARFNTPLLLRAQPRPWQVAIGNYSLSGKNNDIAAATNSGVINVYTSNGDGTFVIQRALQMGGEPNNITVADVNGDGRPDLIASDLGSGSVSVFLHK